MQQNNLIRNTGKRLVDLKILRDKTVARSLLYHLLVGIARQGPSISNFGF